jgi:hypothetical protein
MAEEDKFHVGKPAVFDGNNYDYWKKRMEVHFKALGRDFWRIVMEGSDGEIWTAHGGVNPSGLVVRWG